MLNLATLDSAMAAQFQGQQLLEESDARRAETAFRKQQTEKSKIETQAQERQLKDREALTQFMKADEASSAQPAQSAQEKAQFYSKAGQFAARRGDFEASKQMSDLAKGELDVAAKEQATQANTKATALEELATVALDAETNPTASAHSQVFKAAVKAGIPPQDVPLPGTPQYSAFVKKAQTASLTAKDRIQTAEKVREFDQRQEAQKLEADARREDRKAQLAQTAANQSFARSIAQQNVDIRKQLAESTIAAREAKATAPPKLSATMERQATAVVNAANEAGQALTRMSKMGSTATMGVFAHLEDPTTVLKSLTRTGTNKMTPESIQMLQANSQMLGLEVAQAMAAPFKPNKEQISEARRATEVVQGDTEYTGMYKLALAADILKTRLEATPKTKALEEARHNAETTLGKFPTATEVYEHAKQRGIKLGKRKAAPTFMDRLKGMTDTSTPPAEIQNLLDKYPAAK